MKVVWTVILLSSVIDLHSQGKLTLDECYRRAEANYPLVKQRELIPKSRSLSVDNVYRSALPQVTLGGQATYQSEVTRIPFEAPGVEPISKDQYRIFGEVSQTLYHGGIVGEKAALEEANHLVAEYELQVELYQLRERINELYFGILLSSEQIAQSELIKSDLSIALRKVQSSITQGSALRSAADVLNAEILRIDQRIIELNSVAETFRRMLSMFINTPVEESVILERPVFEGIFEQTARPELQLFDAQERSIDQSQRVLTAGKKPRIDLFVQGGYGRPGLNMLDNTFAPYYVGGVRLSWPLSGYYTLERERQLLQIKRQSLQSRRETFLFNNGMVAGQQEGELARLQKLLQVDDEIIALRRNVRETAAVQLEEGIITPTDFIREVNAEDAAKQARSLHETQLLMAQAKLVFTSGQN